ncbi:MAG: M67 family metallopeptidase [Magnetococcales bacterium]|nr:M67 family metallopeptidase [Magnetococcales bacterium]
MWEIPRILINKVLGHAQRSAPEECVGVLTGEGRRVRGWRPLTNVLADSRRFMADPAQQLVAFREIRDSGQSVVAIYHSHPTGPAEPSALDLQQAAYPEVLQLIVSLAEDGRMDLGGFLVQEGRAKSQVITITEG